MSASHVQYHYPISRKVHHTLVPAETSIVVIDHLCYNELTERLIVRKVVEHGAKNRNQIVEFCCTLLTSVSPSV